jgi:glucosylglycerol-phosphate synthase
VFVTGRGIESVLPLINDPLIPSPDYVIADVGATVIEGCSLHSIQPLQLEIDGRWIGTTAVMDRLQGIDGLLPQPVPQERRCSFFIEDERLADLVRKRLDGLPCEVLYSAGRYLDVLPHGVSKGSTLTALLELLGVMDDHVLVAGDTLNDRSLFEQAFRGVIVGNAEEALRETVPESERIMHAGGSGAKGILEAIDRHFGDVVSLDREPLMSDTGEAQLVVVYHRLPFDEQVINGRRVRKSPSSPNGIIPTLLGTFRDGRAGSWVAWSLDQPRQRPFTRHEMVDSELYPELVTATVPLQASDVERFYHKFSKEAFWPVIFSFVDRAVFRREDWEHFVDVNRRFAVQAAEEADVGATVWIHDYNLWMVPAYLRQLRPDVTISFFHHTSFPPACAFNIIPWADQIVASLLQCDHIGFHIPRYVRNFTEVVQSHVPARVVEVEECAPRYRVRGMALAQEEMPRALEVDGRRIRLGSHPVGVDVAAIRGIVERPESRRRIEELRERFRDQAIVVSVERLDYVKGPLNKLEAFERLLETKGELQGRVVLVLISTPPAQGMAVYDEIRESVDQAVGRISGRYRTLDWTPIHYLFRSIPFDDVTCYYAAADVMWITPLRDGLNLVAKEFVAAQEAVEGSGALILSEFAGASVELPGALITNPYDLDNLAEVLHRALMLDEADKRERLRRLSSVVSNYDVGAWSRDVLATATSGLPD